MKRLFFGCILLWGVGCLTSCQGPMAYIDNVVLARVGDEKLTRPELRRAIPSGLSAEDSTAYAEQYIRAWVDEQLLYRQGVKHLKNMSQIDEQVAEYRRTLVARSYEQQLLEKQVRAVSDDDCWAFYESHAARMRLERPVMQGLLIKTLSVSAGLDALRRNLKNLQNGQADEIELVEKFCLQRAAAYDNFFQRWVDVESVLSRLPATLETQGFRLPDHKATVLEAADSLYTYLLFVKDCRQAGESMPYEVALPEIRERLLRGRRAEQRAAMLQELYDDAVRRRVVEIRE